MARGKKIKQLTLTDIITVLCNYNLTHTKFPHNYMSDGDYDIPYIRGMIIDGKKQIYINSDISYEMKRETVLHELYHADSFIKGYLDGVPYEKMEQLINKATKQHLKKLWGIYKQKRGDLR